MKSIADSFNDLRIADRKGRIALGSKYAGKRFTLREEPDGSTVLTPVQVVPESENPLTSRRLSLSFAGMESLENGWDGRDSPAPSAPLIAYAREVLALLHAGALARGIRWTEAP